MTNIPHDLISVYQKIKLFYIKIVKSMIFSVYIAIYTDGLFIGVVIRFSKKEEARIMKFEAHFSVNMLYGEGIFSQLGEKTAALGVKHAMIVCDKGILNLGLADRAAELLEKAGVKTTVWSDVLPDPPDISIDKAAEIARNEKIDGCVGIGGGSAMDTAKCVGILLSNPGSISQYINSYAPTTVPVICVPTAAGTGAEHSAGSQVTITSAHRKGVASSSCPSLAVVDPELTYGSPKGVTLNSVLDSFAHNAEVLLANHPTYYTEILSAASVKNIVKYLPIALKDPNNAEARDKLMFASTEVGSTMFLASPNWGHGFGHAIGARYHCPHGYAVAYCLPALMEIYAQVLPEQSKILADAMEIQLPENADHEVLGKTLRTGVQNFFDNVGAPKLKDLADSAEELFEITELVKNDPMSFLYPRPLTDEEICNIFKEAYNS